MAKFKASTGKQQCRNRWIGNALLIATFSGDCIYLRGCFAGSLQSLKHFKNEVESIRTDVECGLSFKDQSVAPQAGDVVVCFEYRKVQPELNWDLDFWISRTLEAVACSARLLRGVGKIRGEIFWRIFLTSKKNRFMRSTNVSVQLCILHAQSTYWYCASDSCLMLDYVRIINFRIIIIIFLTLGRYDPEGVLKITDNTTWIRSISRCSQRQVNCREVICHYYYYYSWAAISLWNNFETILGKFPRAEIKLFQTDVDAYAEIILK